VINAALAQSRQRAAAMPRAAAAVTPGSRRGHAYWPPCEGCVGALAKLHCRLLVRADAGGMGLVMNA